jgi:putative salt-induced outer membrane protein YdiY
LLLFPVRALAQAPATPPPAREGSADFAFVATTGNASTQTIGLTGELIFRPDTWVIKNRAVFVHNESEDTLTAESFLYIVRAEKALSPRLAGFGEYDYLRDTFAGLDHRNHVLGGVSYKMVDLPAHLLFVDAGLGYLNEQRRIEEDLSTGTYAFGGGYKWKLSPTAEISDDIRFTNTFADAADWRVANIASVTARLTTIFSIKFSNTLRHVHEPVDDFKGTDTITSVALVAKF